MWPRQRLHTPLSVSLAAASDPPTLHGCILMLLLLLLLGKGCCRQQEPSCCFHQQQKLHWDAGHTPSQITLLGRGFATGPMKERTLLLSLAQCCANVEDAGTALSQRKDLPVAVQLSNPLRIVHVPLVVSPNPSGFTLRSRTPGAIQYGNTP